MDEPDILVHISAPQTRKHDDLYRSLAEAYITFEPHQPRTVGCVSDHAEDGIVDVSSTAAALPVHDHLPEANTSIAPYNISKDSYGSFPSHISSDGHQQVPIDLGPSTIASATESPVDSSRLQQLERIHASWKRQEAPIREADSLGLLVSSLQNSGVAFIDDSQLAAQAIESQLRDDFSTTSEDTSEEESSSMDPGKWDMSTQLPPKSSEPESIQCDHRSSSERRQPSQASAASAAKSIPVHAGLHETAQFLSPAASTPSIKHDASSTVLDIASLPCSIFPPPPALSLESPGTLPSQVTGYLSALKRQNPDRYKPLRKLRGLEDDERGYWLVSCAHWALKEQYDFWTSLSRDIESGKFGWGISLHRGAGKREDGTIQYPSGLGEVRLYCWGEVVEYVWLGMWLSSNGKIAGSGSAWLDAENSAIVSLY
ncbi:hypothetical protein P154DRAFT_523240 [Amniculicola lignicola CBS 123094]|uniref:Uncharacterized protein n=1 Tax=Amniculicola lignicola CBS 123094 TaxID=1392246 RepID=A0A6A5WCN9_9PLEO|nr:hypothetical protein P154DRAFT_523240 [Amniculicola lignicola CBS 123094]